MKSKLAVYRFTLVLTLALTAVGMGGCDSAKEELEKTRTERDGLKTQVSNMHASMESVAKDLTEAKAQAAKCQPVPVVAPAVAPIVPVKAAPAAHPTGKGASGKSPAAK